VTNTSTAPVVAHEADFAEGGEVDLVVSAKAEGTTSKLVAKQSGGKPPHST
jgi:hypothetical protein